MKNLLKNYWFPIAGLITIAVMWGSTTNKINADETDITNLQTQSLTIEQNVTQTKIDIAVIKNDTGQIKDDIKFIKNKVQ